MAYGSTLTDLQTGVNNEAAIQASREASQRDYYARLAEMRRLRDAQNQNNAYQNRALDTNARLQGRQIDNTGAYQTGTLGLGRGQLDETVAGRIAEDAYRQNLLAQQERMANAANANAMKMAEIQAGALSPKAYGDVVAANSLSDEANKAAEAAAARGNYLLEQEDMRAKNEAAKMHPFKAIGWSSSLADDHAQKVKEIIAGLGPDGRLVKPENTPVVGPDGRPTGEFKLRLVPLPLQSNYGMRSPVPTVTPVDGTGKNGPPPGSPIPPSADNSVAPAIRSLPDISSWSVTGSGGGGQAPATYSAPVTQIPSAPVTVVPRATGIPGMGGTFGGGPSPLVQDPVLVKNTILARQMDAWLASFPPDKQPSLAEKRAHARLLNSQYQSQ